LRLDSQRAWRQGEDAILFPIVYELPSFTPVHPDEVIVDISRQRASFLPVELLSWEERKKNLASLKKKAETGNFRVPKNAQKNQLEIDPSFAAPVDPVLPQSKHLSRSVPLLLLAVIALVLVAWRMFR